MTVRNALPWQDRKNVRSCSEAAGELQIMEDTLRDYLVPTMSLTGREVFTADMQNAMAVVLMQRRDWSPEGTNPIRMGNAPTRQWAALPLPSGPDTGKSAHHNTKRIHSHALITTEQFLTVLRDPTKAKAILNSAKHTRTQNHKRVSKRGVGGGSHSHLQTHAVHNTGRNDQRHPQTLARHGLLC